MEDKILKVFREMIMDFKVIDVEEISIECGEYSYADVLHVLREHGIPMVMLCEESAVLFIVREDADIFLDVRAYLDRNSIGFNEKDSEYIDTNWDSFSKVKPIKD